MFFEVAFLFSCTYLQFHEVFSPQVLYFQVQTVLEISFEDSVIAMTESSKVNQCGNWGGGGQRGQGGHWPPPIFGRSVNPILIRGVWIIAYTHYTYCTDFW